jgi:hypothetical protein
MVTQTRESKPKYIFYSLLFRTIPKQHQLNSQLKKAHKALFLLLTQIMLQ